jgi:hypothetical protein
LKFLGELRVGRACAGTSEKELTTCAKKGGQEELKNICTKEGSSTRPRPAGDSGPTPDFAVYFNFFEKKNFFRSLEKGPGGFGRMDAQCTHFFKLPPTLGSMKSSIPHKVWIFYFFWNFIFSKFIVHLDLHINRSDFRCMEN